MAMRPGIRAMPRKLGSWPIEYWEKPATPRSVSMRMRSTGRARTKRIAEVLAKEIPERV
jgi:hypothetical protein